MMRRRMLLPLLAVSLAFLSVASAADEERKEVSDEEFVRLASAGDLAEINLGRLAQQRAERPEVKTFGQRMVADHTKSSQELLQIANKKNFTPAKQMDKHHQEVFERLGKLQGAEFDREYVSHMVKGHKKMAQLYTGQAKNGKDAELKAFAEKTLPVVSQHLKMARELAGERDTDNGKGRDNQK